MCYADSLVGMFRDRETLVRQAAVKALGKLDATEIAPHAGAIVGMLCDADVTVHYDAMLAFRKLGEEALTSHATAIVCILADPDWVTRRVALEALSKMKPVALAPHVGAIVVLVHDTHSLVRAAAMKVLFILDKTALALHAVTIVGMLTDSRTEIRRCALLLLESSSTGVSTSELLALAILAVTNMLTDTEFVLVHHSVISTLHRLKRKRAQLHWVTARVYRARWYVRFWYEFVVERLCAPGGAWAERDRAAFEDEFRVLL